MILKASVLIVLLCLIFGICFRYRYRLAEPVFVQQNTAGVVCRRYILLYYGKRR